MIKILHLVPALTAGGIEMVLNNYFQHVNKEEFQMDILSFGPISSLARQQFNALGCYVYELCPPIKKSFSKHKKNFMHFIENKSYNILHIHTNYAAKCIYGKWARQKGIPYVIMHSHSAAIEGRMRAILHRIYQKKVYKYCNLVLACSYAAGKFMCANRSFEVLHNALDLQRFCFDLQKRENMRDKLGIGEDALVIGNIGRMVAIKNQDVVIKILAEINSRGKKAYAILVGDGEKKDDLCRLAKQLGVSEKCIFPGVCMDTEYYYNAMDVYLQPSTYEGLGVSVIEAQACGCACVVSDTVPEEVKILERCVFLPLNTEISRWGDKVLELSSYAKKDESQLLRNAGYDIVREAQKLEIIYRGFVTNET